MIIITLFKKFDAPILISKKYGIVIDNLHNEEKKYLYELIEEELIKDQKAKRYGYIRKSIEELILSPYYSNAFKDIKYNDLITLLCDNIICIDTIYTEESYLKLKNKYTDSPSLEVSNEEKFLSLFNYIYDNSYKTKFRKSHQIHISFCDSDDWIYARNNHSSIISSMRWHDCPNELMKNNPYRFTSHGAEYEYKIKALLRFGHQVDDYIQNEQDFYILDYVIDAISDERYSTFAIVKLFSLFETLLAHKNYSSLRQELIFKLPQFIPDDIKEKESWIKLVYDVRSKLAHGDYKGVNAKTDKYIEKFMGGWNFDYYEFSKINWAYSGIYGTLKTVVANIVWSMINVKPLIKKIKEQKCDNWCDTEDT